MKKFAVLAVLAVAAMAVAAIVQFAFGQGAARNSEGIAGHFRFEARKFINGDHQRVSGVFRWRSELPAVQRAVAIETINIRRFVKEENTARFSGPAHGVFINGGVRHAVRGIVVVHVQDNEHATLGHTPDRIRVGFEVPGTNFQYGFEGAVVDGNIVVGQREVTTVGR